ncbi:hypothetical protein BDV06DRAFT_202204 [Aspergillus oleicola]
MAKTAAHVCIVAGYWHVLQGLPEFKINRVLLGEAELNKRPEVVEIKRSIAVQGTIL